jgi:hypothetical protein
MEKIMSKSKKNAKNTSKQPKTAAPKQTSKKRQAKNTVKIEAPVASVKAVGFKVFKEPELDGTETPFTFTSHASFPSSINDQITDAVTQFFNKIKCGVCKAYGKVKSWISSLSI